MSGLDGPNRRALPIGEFLHPVSLVCVAVLALNDHFLKGSGLLPGLVTGKLSDFTGLAFFPLLCTALVDVVLLAASRLGARIDFSLRRWKIGVAVAATAIFFSAIKLSPIAAETVAGWLSVTGWNAQIVADPTDLIALVALLVPVWIGAAEIARVPLGRLEVMERCNLTGSDELKAALSDVGDSETVSLLVDAIVSYRRNGDSEPLDKTLQSIRFPPKRASS